MFSLISLAAVLAASGPACSAPSDLLQAPTADVAISSKFDATVWGGEQIKTRNTITLSAPGAAAPQLTLLDETSGKSTQAPAKLSPCGVVTNDRLNTALVSYNNALALATSAPSNVAAGASWNGTVNMYVSQTEQLNIPVKITVAKKDASGTLLQATGRTSGILTQFNTPYELTYQGAALFKDGKLLRADSAAQEAVQAGPQSQTMTFAWTISRKS